MVWKIPSRALVTMGCCGGGGTDGAGIWDWDMPASDDGDVDELAGGVEDV